MKKGLFFTVSATTAILLTGCSTTKPEPSLAPAPVVAATEPVTAIPAPVQPVLLEEIQKLSAEIAAAGGLAAVGTTESKNLDLALNKAKVNGRIELARIVKDRIEVLAKAFSDETGIPYESLILSGFNNTEKALAGQIASSLAQTLKYEQIGDSFTAYAVMALDPKAIADQLAQEKDLYTRLKVTKSFETLTREIKTYATFKASQK